MKKNIQRGIHLGVYGVILAWDKTESKLYLDLNRDGDLTNDPEGVLGSEDAARGKSQHQRQEFPEFDFGISTDPVHAFPINCQVHQRGPGNTRVRRKKLTQFTVDLLHKNLFPKRFGINYCHGITTKG